MSRLERMENSTGGPPKIELTGSPDILSANVPISATETKGEEIEVGVKGEAGRCANGGLRECEE